MEEEKMNKKRITEKKKRLVLQSAVALLAIFTLAGCGEATAGYSANPVVHAQSEKEETQESYEVKEAKEKAEEPQDTSAEDEQREQDRLAKEAQVAEENRLVEEKRAAAEHLAQLGLTEAHVANVIDGDTFVLSSGERVRLIGVDTPEVNEVGANEATAFTRERLEGQTVWLEQDGNNTDPHGRLRRYVWLELPSDVNDENQIRTSMLNALLLENGHAQALFVGSPRHEALFTRLDTTPSAPVVEEVAIPTDDGERIVYVTGGGRSQVYWFSTEFMPANTNRNNIITMTRSQAQAEGRRLSQMERAR